MEHIQKLTVTLGDSEVGTLSLTPEQHFCTFEYAAEWLAGGFSISPLEMPLKPGVFIAKARPFKGNFGIFEDSLPDGYGRFLLHKYLCSINIDDTTLSALDRLSIVGSGGMGALCYSPHTDMQPHEEFDDFDLLQQKALDVLSEHSDNDANLLLYNSGNSGGARPKAIFSDKEGHWLVKFRHTYDPKDIGLTEYRHNQIARACGIAVPDFRLINGKYFATRRFDISHNGTRLHVATAGGLLGVSHSQPILDYDNLLALTGFLTQNPEDVEMMLRVAAFNYITGNLDDHSKNFSFRVLYNKERRPYWQLAPAYDLTPCNGGYNGQHATSVNGTSNPTAQDFIAIATHNRIPLHRAQDILDQILAAAAPISRYTLK